ncbi:MAG: VOC family protein [Steroidobacteraceae bacterium]|jgi:catechol 2,3-dioxygenase-like lactoylglutathione lyase family enzyme
MSRLDHVGMTVEDLDRSIAFYCSVLDCIVRERAVIDGAQMQTLTGVSAAQIHTADLQLPGGGMLELLQYVGPVPAVLEQRRHDAGHSHVAFCVEDIDETRRRALAAGALDCSAPVRLDEPGSSWDRACVCYARDPDGRTIEFVERSPPTAPR